MHVFSIYSAAPLLTVDIQDVVIFRDGAELTLQQVFQSLKLTAYDLSIDTLDMHAHSDSFHRFDKFNLKYNPIGESRLREIFLKTDNYIKGRYLAELTRGELFMFVRGRTGH
jgi:AMP deaminase